MSREAPTRAPQRRRTADSATDLATSAVPAEPELEAPVEEIPAPLAGRAFADPGVRRTGGTGASADAADPLGGTAAPAEVDAVLQRRRGGGRPLPDGLGENLGQQFGTDLSAVRVHDDAEADHVARSVASTAFTHGTDIYFTQGAYSPGSTGGQQVLAHELTHVVQQSQGRGSGSGATTIGRADDPAEAEADAVARRVVPALQRQAARVPVVPLRGGTSALRRWPNWSWFKKKKKKAPEPELVTVGGGTGGTTGGTGGTGGGTGGETGGRKRSNAVVSRPKGPPPSPPVESTGPKTVEQDTTASPKEAPPPVLEQPAPEPEPTKDKAGFTAIVGTPAAPADATEAQTRFAGLRALLKQMTSEERAKIAADKALMAKARIYLGDLQYMALLPAVGMFYKAPQGSGTPDAGHMSGADADTFIRENLGKINHLKPYLEAAVGAGKQAEGYVAVLGPDDWKIAYEAQYPGETIAGGDDATTNAFIGNKHKDRPALLHHGRGTRSTAIHESMHRYSELAVLNTYGSPLNEGITEYFTRRIADSGGNPAGSGLAPDRTNYQKNFSFVKKLVALLGGDLVSQETALADVYFSGKVDLLKTKFVAACKKKGIDKDDAEERWTRLTEAISNQNWTDANAELP